MADIYQRDDLIAALQELAAGGTDIYVKMPEDAADLDTVMPFRTISKVELDEEGDIIIHINRYGAT